MTGRAVGGAQPEGVHEGERAMGEWQSRVPASIRESAGLSEHEVSRLFAAAERALRRPSSQALQEVETTAHEIGRQALPALGLEPALRYLRDEVLLAVGH